jgi:mannose/fructose/N-acetylgalactosamine-specific phosphotransferase system component IIB
MKRKSPPLASNLIWRIDDRLIHGQIIIGWCGQLPIQALVVCDDRIAATPWQKELVLMAAPSNLETHIYSVSETAQHFPQWISQNKLMMILMKSPRIIRELINAGTDIRKVNIGGMHSSNERKEYLSYLFLSDAEADLFEKLMQEDVYFYCQDLPNSPVYDLSKLIAKKK